MSSEDKKAPRPRPKRAKGERIRKGKGCGKPPPDVVFKADDVAQPELLKPKMGRPSMYSEDLVQEILDRVAMGQGIYKISKDKNMPCWKTLWDWIREKPEFEARYARAKEQSAENFADQLIEIADNCEDPNKARLQIETRKWIAAKLLPKRYGDKIDINKTVDIAITAIKRVVVDEAIDADVIASDRLLAQDD